MTTHLMDRPGINIRTSYDTVGPNISLSYNYLTQNSSSCITYVPINFRPHCTGVVKNLSVIFMEALSPWVGIL